MVNPELDTSTQPLRDTDVDSLCCAVTTAPGAECLQPMAIAALTMTVVERDRRCLIRNILSRHFGLSLMFGSSDEDASFLDKDHS